MELILQRVKEYLPVLAVLIVPVVALRALAATYYRPEVAMAVLAESSVSNVAAVILFATIQFVIFGVLTLIAHQLLTSIDHHKWFDFGKYSLLYIIAALGCAYMLPLGWLFSILSLGAFSLGYLTAGSRLEERVIQSGTVFGTGMRRSIDVVSKTPPKRIAVSFAAFMAGLVFAMPTPFLASQRLELDSGQSEAVNVLHATPAELVVLTSDRVVSKVPLGRVRSIEYCNYLGRRTLSQLVLPTGYPNCSW